MKRKEVVTGIGSVLAAIVASSCCWLPLLLLAVGAGTTAVGAVTHAIDASRPVFAVAAIGFLGAAWYFTYFRRPVRFVAAPGKACCAGEPEPGSKTDPAPTDACCASEPDREAHDAVCSCCGLRGKAVSASTVRALVRPDLKDRVRDGDYILCLNPGCAQVYSGPAGARPFVKSDLAVRVGYKEAEGPHLVCYCFEQSVEDIEEELRSTGKAGIPDRIRREVKEGHCQCEIKNPQGVCCLGNVNRAIREAQARIAGGLRLEVAPGVQCAPPTVDEDHKDCCRLPAGVGSVTRRLKQINKVMLPIMSVLILGMVFFPDRVLSFLAKREASGSAGAVTNTDAKSVVLSVPGMT